VNHLFAFLLIIFFFMPAAAGFESAKIEKGNIVSNGKNRSYYIFVPDSVKPATPAPLIVMLHGSGRNGQPLVEKWKELAAKEGIILVGPDAINSEGWSSPVDGPDFLHDVVESLKSKYAINPRRVYLFGHSAGAIFAIYMSLFQSEYLRRRRFMRGQ
jgi:poly(3-hydroxybutyrate) depolymerase